MNKPSSDNSDRSRHRREKATIDHLVDRAFDPESTDTAHKPSTSEGGTPIEEQVRKEWDPRKGSLPTF